MQTISIYGHIYFNSDDIENIFKNNIHVKEIQYPKLKNTKVIETISKYALIYTDYLYSRNMYLYIYTIPPYALVNKNHKFISWSYNTVEQCYAFIDIIFKEINDDNFIDNGNIESIDRIIEDNLLFKRFTET